VLFTRDPVGGDCAPLLRLGYRELCLAAVAARGHHELQLGGRTLRLHAEPLCSPEGHVLAVLVTLERPARPQVAARAPDPFAPIFAQDEALLGAIRWARQLARSRLPVMLLAETGTGKELFAQAIHGASPRAARPFVAVNAGAIPENLLESELFGHEKGAFTGAVKTTEGKIELADGGTLFLDEVGDIPLPLQVKLLRFLQERTIERIGGRQHIAVDTRIVCATHQDLEAMLAEGRFREDLFYRLAEIVVKIPGLAERPGDAILLAKAFLNRFAAEMNPQVKGFAADALAAIDGWPWPGNVRELENRVKRAVIMADGKLVSAEDLDLDNAEGSDAEALNLKSAREQADRRMIRHALARSEGNISNTAKLLGISRPTLYDLLKHYDLQA
jgi:two-component system NtrC family response regulator